MCSGNKVIKLTNISNKIQSRNNVQYFLSELFSPTARWLYSLHNIKHWSGHNPDLLSGPPLLSGAFHCYQGPPLLSGAFHCYQGPNIYQGNQHTEEVFHHSFFICLKYTDCKIATNIVFTCSTFGIIL